MKKTTIYFVRHGEVHNPDDILYGRLSGFSLSQEGIRDISKLSKYFKNKQIDYLYSSPLLRTKQTAKILSKVIGVEPKSTKLLIEVDIIFQGINLNDFRDKYQPFIYDQKYIKKGQESIEDIYKRMLKFVKLVSERHRGKKVVAVSHGDPIAILRARTMGKNFTSKYKQENYLHPGTFLKLVVENGKFSWR